MEEWAKWSIGTLISLGSLVVAYFSLREKPGVTQKQKVSKNHLHQSPMTKNTHRLVNRGDDPKTEPVKTSLEEKISERDKKIIHHLFTEVLDLDMAQDTLEVQATWYGYKKVAIYNLIEFSEDAVKLSCLFRSDRATYFGVMVPL